MGSEIRYVCEGTCRGMVAEKDFKFGRNRCATARCPNHGLVLVRKEYCPQCNTTFEEGEEHACI